MITNKLIGNKASEALEVVAGANLMLNAGDSASYPGSGTKWYDISGNNEVFTLQNGVVFDSGNGGHFQLTRTSSHYFSDDGTTTYLTGSGTPCTIEIWASYNEISNFWYPFIDIKSGTGKSLKFGVVAESNYGTYGRMYLGGSSGWDQCRFEVKDFVNKIHQIIVVYNGGLITSPSSYYMLIDGKKCFADGASAGFADVGNITQIGADFTNYLNGTIYAVNIYDNKEFTPAEVRQNAAYYKDQIFGFSDEAAELISLAGLTGSEASAVTTLVEDLKTCNAWNKLDCLYPFVGGTADKHKWNLIDPRDLDSSYRITWNGSVTHDANGITGDGSTGYGESHYSAFQHMDFDNGFLAVYNKTTGTGISWEVGAGDPGAPYYGMQLQCKASDSDVYGGLHGVWHEGRPDITGIEPVGIVSLNKPAEGFVTEFRLNGTLLSSGNQNGLKSSDQTISILGLKNDSGVVQSFSLRNLALVAWGGELTTAEMLGFQLAVQRFQNTLGRGSTDADATAFISAAGITDVNHQTALHLLVSTLKSRGLWTKLDAIYPIVGGTADAHKWNLKDPRDLDAAFRLNIQGTWTHSATGMKGNGSDNYADTFFVPSAQWTLTTDGHMSVYSRTNQNVSEVEIGAYDTSVNSICFIQTKELGSNFTGLLNHVAGSSIYIANADGRGLYSIAYSSSNTRLYKNGTEVKSGNKSYNGLGDLSIYLGAYNHSTPANSSKEIAFATIGDSLIATEMELLYDVIQEFQTYLGRQV